MAVTPLSRQCVASGFEAVTADAEVCPGSAGRTWNLWWNVKLTDDPQSWDDEITLINTMRDGLDALTTEQCLIRAHMAEFCRLSSLSSRNMQILCEEIGVGTFSSPMRMGCEGRRLPNALEHNDTQSLREQSRTVLAKYTRALIRWLSRSTPETSWDSKVTGFLGQATRDKRSCARELTTAICSEKVAISALKELAEHE
jgi:hypothetical protein